MGKADTYGTGENKRECRECGVEKELRHFEVVKKSTGLRRRVCTKCRSDRYKRNNKDKVSKGAASYYDGNKVKILEKGRNRYAQSPESKRSARLKVYGLTVEEYNMLLDKQGGVCAICSKPETTLDPRVGTVRSLAVDHDHKTGKVRGLLCGKCNHAIGLMGDNPNTLELAADYIRMHTWGGQKIG